MTMEVILEHQYYYLENSLRAILLVLTLKLGNLEIRQQNF